MSNNARGVACGAIGGAQHFQAVAARTVPYVRVNPVRLKVAHDNHNQLLIFAKLMTSQCPFALSSACPELVEGSKGERCLEHGKPQ